LAGEFFMKKTKMSTSRLPEAIAAFSRGLKLELDNNILLFISGTASIDKNDQVAHVGNLYDQTMHTYKNIISLLEPEGAGLRDIVKFTIYLKTMDDYAEFNRARDDFFAAQGLKREDFPASTCVEARLCRDELLVEMEAIVLLHKTINMRLSGGYNG